MNVSITSLACFDARRTCGAALDASGGSAHECLDEKKTHGHVKCAYWKPCRVSAHTFLSLLKMPRVRKKGQEDLLFGILVWRFLKMRNLVRLPNLYMEMGSSAWMGKKHGHAKSAYENPVVALLTLFSFYWRCQEWETTGQENFLFGSRLLEGRGN